MGQVLQWIFLAGLGMFLLVLAVGFAFVTAGLTHWIVEETTDFF